MTEDARHSSKRVRVEETDNSRPIVEESLVQKILESMNVQFEEQCLPVLCEGMHVYCESLLSDAHDYATHAGRKTTEIADLKLALQIHASAQHMPSREDTAELAKDINSKRIPPIKCKTGIQLPTDEFTLLGQPFRVAPAIEEEIPAPAQPEATAPVRRKTGGKKINLNIKSSLS